MILFQKNSNKFWISYSILYMDSNREQLVQNLLNHSFTSTSPLPMKTEACSKQVRPFSIKSILYQDDEPYKAQNTQNHCIKNSISNYLVESKSKQEQSDLDLSKSQKPSVESFSASSSDYSNLRRKFTPKEDIQLKKLIEIYGPKKWDKIAQSMPGRTGRQCRDRFANYLDPSLVNGPWTEQEDILLEQKVYELGQHWNAIAKFFNGRSTNNIKNRWHTYICKQKKKKSKKLLIPNIQQYEYKVQDDTIMNGNFNNFYNNCIYNDNININSFNSELNYPNIPIITLNNNETPVIQSKIIETNQTTNYLSQTSGNEKKILFPPIYPLDNNFLFSVDNGILGFLNQPYII